MHTETPPPLFSPSLAGQGAPSERSVAHPVSQLAAIRPLFVKGGRLAGTHAGRIHLTPDGFGDFLLPGDFPDFPHHSQMASYLEAYVDQFDLRPQICINSEVISARRLADDRWQISLSSGMLCRLSNR